MQSSITNKFIQYYLLIIIKFVKHVSKLVYKFVESLGVNKTNKIDVPVGCITSDICRQQWTNEHRTIPSRDDKVTCLCLPSVLFVFVVQCSSRGRQTKQTSSASRTTPQSVIHTEHRFIISIMI